MEHTTQLPGKDWIHNWCDRTTTVLNGWEQWAIEFGVATMGASAAAIDALTTKGEELASELIQLIRERQSFLNKESLGSLRELLAKYPAASFDFSERFSTIERLSARVRQRCLVQWMSIRQSCNFIEEMLFVFKSGQANPATYSSDEQSAFQGGYLLDSEA